MGRATPAAQYQSVAGAFGVGRGRAVWVGAAGRRMTRGDAGRRGLTLLPYPLVQTGKRSLTTIKLFRIARQP